jgi:ketosteroid isomerase-like protein
MEPTNTTETDETSIRALMNNRIAATRNKDIDGVLSCFSPEVMSFDVVGPLAHNGVLAVRKRLEEWFATLQGAIGFAVSDLKIYSSTDAAHCYGLCHVQATTADGNILDMWWRETTCFSKVNGAWAITHVHSSVPFDVQTGKAAVDLKPA